MSFWFFVSQKYFNLESKVNKLRNQFKSKENISRNKKKNDFKNDGFQFNL